MLKQFLAAMATFIVFDALWLGVIAKEFYRRSLAPVARMSEGALAPVWSIAALVYPVMALGLTVFVISRAQTPRDALLLGALYGATTFAVYDLTNHATLRSWPATLTIVDIGWGAFVCASAAWIVTSLVRV